MANSFTRIQLKGISYYRENRNCRNKTLKQNYRRFIYSPTDVPVRCLKKNVLKFTLKFTLKQLRHVSVLQLHRHQGTHKFVLTKVTVVNILLKTAHQYISWWINKTLIISKCTVRMWPKKIKTEICLLIRILMTLRLNISVEKSKFNKQK